MTRRHPADLAAEMVERELERISHVVADRRDRPLNELMKPILTVFCWATVGAAVTAAMLQRAARKQKSVS